MNIKKMRSRFMRVAVTVFMGIGGAGAGQILTTGHPHFAIAGAVIGCCSLLALAYAMYWR